MWTPLNTNDFAPFLAQVQRDADAVLTLFVGRLALQFMKQWESSGLKARLPLLAGGTTTDESVLPQMGDEALGTLRALHHSAALDSPQNQKFAKAFEAKAGKSASYYSEACYTGARWIVERSKPSAARWKTARSRRIPRSARSISVLEVEDVHTYYGTAQRSRKVKTDRRDARALAEACVLGAYRRAQRLADGQRPGRGRLTVRDALVRTRTGYIAGPPRRA
ncbi:MAG: ABC transporter substrate-binding protein [Candidatus Rokuibacteriota bacterium]